MGVIDPASKRRRKPSLAPLNPAPPAPGAALGGSPIARPLSRGVKAGSSSRSEARSPEGWESDTTSLAADAMSATLSGVAANVKDVIKAYEQTTSLPYDDVPPELCRALAGTNTIDLSSWSLLVNDAALRRIAIEDRDRIDTLARESSINQVGGHIEAMGLAGAFKGVDSSGVASFDATCMVAWREKQTLERMKTEEFDRAREHFAEKEGLTALDIGGSEGVGNRGVAALAAQCRRLQSLNMSGAYRVTDMAIRSLAVSCTGLIRLNLSGCTGVCGPGLATVGECCPKLVDLDLSGCKQIGHWVLTRIFRGCHSLENVSLARCPRVGDQELSELGVGCRGLVRLDLRDCNQISNTGVLEVARRCSSLTVLGLSRSAMPFKVGDISLLALGEGCPALQRLDVSGCDEITDVGLEGVSNGCPAMEYLDIAGCVKVSNAGVNSLCERCPLLTHLGMARLKHVTDVGVARLGSGCPRLTHLDMSGFVNLSDGNQRDFAFTGVQALARGCTELKTLILDKCFQISKMSLRSVGAGLHQLQRLSLAYCPCLTPEGMYHVAKGCPRLTDLNLSNCGSAVTDAAVAVFARGCRDLRSLSLRGVVGVPPPLGAPGIVAVCVHCRELELLDLRDVLGLEDSALACFHEHQMDKLERVNLMNCPKISGVGVQWLVEGCPALSSLNVKGTGVTLTALNIVKERYPYSRIKVGDKFFGLSPLRKMKERVAIKHYASLHAGARKIQEFFRAKKAREEMTRRRAGAAEEKAGLMVVQAWRRKKGRAELQALRLLRGRKHTCAIVMQKLWRKAIARMLRQRLAREREERDRARRATDIQRTYLGVMGRRKACRHRIEVLRIRQLKAAAALAIQQRFRMYRAKVECRCRRVAAERVRVKRDGGARTVQARWRCYRARQELERMKRLLREDRVRRIGAATCVQKAVRASRCRRTLELKRRERDHKQASVTVIQRHYRGACARAGYVELRAVQQAEAEKGAAVTMQCWYRLKTSKALLSVLAMAEHLRQARETKGAKAIQQAYRRYKIRLEAAARKKNHEDEVMAMSRLEDWAATKIQALVRGGRGRANAAARRLDHMARWKEMYDDERGANFYYNKISGEIRWRRPQDFLELLPRPACGDCGFFEAFSECADCGEFFCSACFPKVHSGGKRVRHEFRALYDYYGKRIDYGDGEFPSRWPTDMTQDDANGWKLRVSPDREASEERGDWARYAGGAGDPYQDLYHNTVTGESSYSPPTEWSWMGAATDTVDTTTFQEEDESGNTDWSYGVGQGDSSLGSQVVATGQESPWETHWDESAGVNYYYNHNTGESTYDRPEEISAGGFDGGGGELIKGDESESSSGWIKYYDAEYAVDYFFNIRTSESQYERPEEFQTPRDWKALEDGVA